MKPTQEIVFKKVIETTVEEKQHSIPDNDTHKNLNVGFKKYMSQDMKNFFRMSTVPIKTFFHKSFAN